MEEINLTNPDPNIKVIKLTGDNMIQREKEFDIDASNNPQINFSKIDKLNAKNESNPSISELEEITLDIPNDINIDTDQNKNDLEDGNMLEIDLNLDKENSNSNQLDLQAGGADKNSIELDSIELDSIELDSLDDNTNLSVSDIQKGGLSEIRLDTEDLNENQLDLNLNDVSDLNLSNYNEIDLDNTSELDTQNIKEIEIFDKNMKNENENEEKEKKLDESVEDIDLDLSNKTKLESDKSNYEREVEDISKDKSEDITEDDTLKITNILNSYNKLNKLSKLPYLEGGAYHSVSEIESILPKNLNVLDNGMFEEVKGYLDSLTSEDYNKYLSLLEEFFSERTKKTYIKTNVYHRTEQGEYIRKCKAKGPCDSDFKIIPPRYIKIDILIKYLKEKLNNISSHLRVQRDNFIEISLNKKKPRNLEQKIEIFEKNKEEFNTCSTQYQIIHQYQDLANKISYNTEILNDLKTSYREAKFSDKLKYNEIIEEISEASLESPSESGQSVQIDIGSETRDKIKLYIKSTHTKDIQDKIYSIKDNTKKIDFLIISEPIVREGEDTEKPDLLNKKSNDPIRDLYNNLEKSGELPPNLSFVDFSREHKETNKTEGDTLENQLFGSPTESGEKFNIDTLGLSKDNSPLKPDDVGLGAEESNLELNAEPNYVNIDTVEPKVGDLDAEELNEVDLDTEEAEEVVLDSTEPDEVDLEEINSQKTPSKDALKLGDLDNILGDDIDNILGDDGEDHLPQGDGLSFDNLDDELEGIDDPEQLAELGQVIQGVDEENEPETIDLSRSGASEPLRDEDDAKVVKSLKLFSEKKQGSENNLDSVLSQILERSNNSKKTKKPKKKGKGSKLKITKKANN